MKSALVLRGSSTGPSGGVRIVDERLLDIADAKPSPEALDRIERLEAA